MTIVLPLKTIIDVYAMDVVCPVTLKVERKNQDVVVGHGGDVPTMFSLTLIPLNKVQDIPPCKAYITTKTYKMNNVGQHHIVFQNMVENDIVTGTLNYHRPSPYGKMLNDNYHHGLRILSVKRGNTVDNYDDQYIYFRHIGLFNE